MSVVKDAAEMLETALKAPQPPTFGVYRDPGAALTTPAVVIGPPQLDWETGCIPPTSARFLLYLVVDPSERAVEILWDFVEEVAAIVDGATDAAVLSASPATFVQGITEFPCYEITVECPL